MKNHLPLRHFAAALLILALPACASRQSRPEAASTPTVTRVLGSKAERPGLATSSGEQRESRVAPAYFARAWGDRPSAVEKLFYNDRDGIDAMLDYLGGEPQSIPGLQRAAGGLVKVGLRNGAGQWFETLELKNQRFVVGERG